MKGLRSSGRSFAKRWKKRLWSRGVKLPAKGPFKNNFRFGRERRRARCEARGGSIPQSGAVTNEQRSRWPGAAPPLGAGALWLAGFVAHSSQTAAGMLVVRASPASQIAFSKIGIYF